MTKFNLQQLFETTISGCITFIKNNQTLALSMVIYVLITVTAVAIIDVHHQAKKISYYEHYMDAQEAELQAVVNDKFLLQRTLNEVLEDSRMLQELQQVRK